MDFEKILVPLDGSINSFRALDKAIILSKQNNSKITGLYVINNKPSDMDIFRNFLKQGLKKQYQNMIQKAKRKCKKSNVDFFDFLEYGQEGNTIVSFAQKNNFDLIIMGSRGLGSIKEFFLGSTSNYVVNQSKIPVIVVK